MFAILGFIFPIIKSFLGENLIEKMLVHKQALASSANERERAGLDAAQGDTRPADTGI